VQLDRHTRINPPSVRRTSSMRSKRNSTVLGKLIRPDLHVISMPVFAHLGEQAVLREEIYATGVGANDSTVFGYQERWAEYRYKPSMITGRFRSTTAQTLDFWHLSQRFTAPPVLSDAFIQDTPPIARVVAVTDEPQFIFDSIFSAKVTRPMPMYSVPGLIDHF